MPDTEDVKRAVKEALADKAIADLSGQMTRMSNEMAAGFASVHTRQDTANGKLMKHEIELEKMKSEDTNNSRYQNIMWFAITVLTGVATYFLTNR